MKRRIAVYVMALALIVGCVSKPAPWKPDGGDVANDGSTRQADAEGDILVDLATPNDLGEVTEEDIGDVGPDDGMTGQEVVEEADSIDVDATDAGADVSQVDAADVKDVSEADGEDGGGCIHSCDGMECGDDGCGGSCGACDDEMTCTDDSCGDDGKCTFLINDFSCVIKDTCIPAGTENPLNACQKCQPTTTKTDWSSKDDGIPCGQNAKCEAGECTCLFEPCLENCCDVGQLCDGESCCSPNCIGKQCGDDGCGGSCGECAGSQDACIEGGCVCQPNCDGKQCGEDGCAGSCGSCQGDQAVCLAGECICEPSCKGKECGDDGCGGECGPCESGICSLEHFACVPGGWVVVEGGDFWMGSDVDEKCRQESEGPQHLVTISNDLMVSDHEVTKDEWKALPGIPIPNWFAALEPEDGCLLTTCPVERVNWYEALFYCNVLSLTNGLKPCYELAGCQGAPGLGCENSASCNGGFTCDEVSFSGVDCGGYRLPTEAEWEFLARAGTSTAFPFPPPDGSGMGEVCSCQSADFLDVSAWYCGNSDWKTHGVKLKNANGLGLHDMAGNVGEWCYDELDLGYYTEDPQTDPLGGEGTNRVVRGGDWQSPPAVCRSAQRASVAPDYRSHQVGFRVVRSLTGCVPSCKDKNCGDDGCGGTCGECFAPNACVNGLCGIECDDGNDEPWDGCTDGVVTEFWVKPNASDHQEMGDVEALAGGDWVVVFQEAGEDYGGGLNVYGRLFAGEAASEGTILAVPATTEFTQHSPRVSGWANGDFVVVWTSDKQDGHSRGVFGQLFGANASKIGAEFQANTEAYGAQEDPDVVVVDGDHFVVLWSTWTNGPEGVFAQVFSAAGQKIGGEHKLSDSGRYVSAALTSDGDLVVSWSDDGIFARRFSLDSGPLPGVFQVSANGQDSAEQPAVTDLSGGGWIVAWESAIVGAQPLTPEYVDDVYFRSYGPDGVPVALPQLLNTTTLKAQYDVALATSPLGGSKAFWCSANQPGTGEASVVGRSVAADGLVMGSEFKVSSNPDSDNEGTRAAYFADGSSVVVWSAKGYGSYQRILAQRFDKDGNRLHH